MRDLSKIVVKYVVKAIAFVSSIYGFIRACLDTTRQITVWKFAESVMTNIGNVMLIAALASITFGTLGFILCRRFHWNPYAGFVTYGVIGILGSGIILLSQEDQLDGLGVSTLFIGMSILGSVTVYWLSSWIDGGWPAANLLGVLVSGADPV
jgi:hypothetical protein